MVRGSKIDDETSSSSLSFFRWPSKDSDEGLMEDQSKLMMKSDAKNDDKAGLIRDSDSSEGMSPELMGAGAIAATIATISGIYYFSMMDIRYVCLTADLATILDSLISFPY